MTKVELMANIALMNNSSSVGSLGIYLANNVLVAFKNELNSIKYKGAVLEWWSSMYWTKVSIMRKYLTINLNKVSLKFE